MDINKIDFKLEVKLFSYKKIQLIVSKIVPTQINGFVTWWALIVTCVKSFDFLDVNPKKSITVTAPRPIIKPAK